jgi:hypothetical protein
MWILFVLGVALSYITYLIENGFSLATAATGALNTADMLCCTGILIAVAIWGKREMHFDTFDKYYLGGIGLIVVYACVTGDMWKSNVFSQLLITAGYIPTIRKMKRLQQNTEPFGCWLLALAASLCGMYPAMYESNGLSFIYASRSAISVIALMGVMFYYELRPVLSMLRENRQWARWS